MCPLPRSRCAAEPRGSSILAGAPVDFGGKIVHARRMPSLEPATRGARGRTTWLRPAGAVGLAAVALVTVWRPGSAPAVTLHAAPVGAAGAMEHGIPPGMSAAE